MEGTGTPIEPVSSFCSVEEFKRYLDPTAEPDTERDQLFGELIVEAAEMIRNEVGRELRVPVASMVRELWVDADQTLVIPEELLTIVSVVDEDGAPVSYRIERRDDRGHVSRLRLGRTLGHAGAVTVSGTWGYATVPSILKTATKQTVRWWFEGDVAHMVKEIGENGAMTAPRSLPDTVIESLERAYPSVGLS